MKQEDINIFANLLSSFEITAFSKNQENEEDGKLRRFKEKWIFISTMGLIWVAFSLCIFTTFLGSQSKATIALNGVIGLALGMGGYYARGKSK